MLGHELNRLDVAIVSVGSMGCGRERFGANCQLYNNIIVPIGSMYDIFTYIYRTIKIDQKYR